MNTRQEGFTLVEVIVAMVMLAIVLTSLAGLSFAASATAIRNADEAAVRAHSLEVVNQYMTLPWNTVRAANTCANVTDERGVFRRCVTGVQNGRMATITVIVTPQQRRQRPDTVRFVRMQP